MQLQDAPLTNLDVNFVLLIMFFLSLLALICPLSQPNHPLHALRLERILRTQKLDPRFAGPDTIMSKNNVFKSLFAVGLGVAALLCGALVFFSYQSYTSPEQVYGSWIEINAPGYHTEVLTLNDQGVFRNHRLVSTRFDYDGKKIQVETGKGRTVYALAGTQKSPQLKRIEPATPVQRFIKQGFEDTISDDGQPSSLRRNALSNHFSDD